MPSGIKPLEPTSEEVAERRKKWVEALRSGDYEQAISRLRLAADYSDRVRDRFCCLGVACDLAAQDGVGEWDDEMFQVDRTDNHPKHPAIVTDRSGGTMPTAIRQYYGIDAEDGNIPVKDDVLDRDYPKTGLKAKHVTLSTLNDSGKSFDFIAEVIEKGGIL